MDFGALNVILNVVSLLAVVAGGFAWYRSSLSQSTIKLYQENQEALDARMKTLRDELDTALADVQAMKGRIKVIETLPLDSITSTLAAVLETQNSILQTQNKILHYMESTPPAVSITNNPAVAK